MKIIGTLNSGYIILQGEDGKYYRTKEPYSKEVVDLDDEKAEFFKGVLELEEGRDILFRLYGYSRKQIANLTPEQVKTELIDLGYTPELGE